MFIDFRSVSDGTVIESDLCIIGAGAAGITIAREFINSEVRVCLVESGGLEFEDDIQDLYAGENIGRPYFDLDATRLRYLGGSTNHWGAWCAPLNEIDFEVRSWVPYSGWPITKGTLLPFYERAQPVCRLGGYMYDERVWSDVELQPPPFDEDKVRTRFWQIGPLTRFGEVYRKELETADNVQVLLHATVTNIQADQTAASVDHVDVRALQGPTGRVSAKYFILACGGLENPRMLLVSNSVVPKGLGNGNDLVGRFFMEHPHTLAGVVASSYVDELAEMMLQINRAEVPYQPGLCTGVATQRRERVLNASVEFHPYYKLDSGPEAAQDIWQSLKRGQFPDEFGEKIWRVLKDLDDVVRDTYVRLAEGKRSQLKTMVAGLYTRSEQVPNPDSRVTLSRARDATGLNRLALDWRLAPLDKDSIRTFMMTLGGEFARLKLGRVRLDDWLAADDDAWHPLMEGGHHHMGTTRMADDPKMGVVDKDCRIHGMSNLFIAGSSVFPTSGYANPTLTIVALALRLADTIKNRLG